MKKIFWTTVFWLGLIFLFWAYVRLFDSELGNKISQIILDEPEITVQTGLVVDSSKDMVLVNEQLDKIEDKLENILQSLGETKETPIQNIPSSATTPLQNPLAQ